MNAIYFTLVAIGLYLISDWLLTRVEIARGKRFEHRSIIFFVILLTLSLISFEFIDWASAT